MDSDVRLDMRRIVLLLICEFLLFTSMDLVLIGFPLHLDRLGMPEDLIGGLVALFNLAAMVARFFIWYLALRVGEAVVLRTAVLASTVVPPLYLLSAHPLLFALLRPLHAFAPAAFMTGVPLILLRLGPESMRGTLLGLFGAVSSFSLATGPVLAIWLMAEERGIAWLYLSSAAAGALAGLALWGADLRGVGGGPATSEQAKPTIDLGLLREPIVRRTCALMALATTAFGGVLSFAAVYAERLDLAGPEGFFVSLALISMVARAVSGRISDIIGYRVLVVPALAVMSTGLGVMAWVPTATGFILAGSLMGAGYGATHTTLMAYLLGRMSQVERWGAATWLTTAFELGVTMGPVVLGIVAAQYSFSSAFLLLGVLALAGAVGAIALLREGRPVAGASHR